MIALQTTQLLTGLGIALFAVVFWAGGFVVAYFLWNRWRGEDGPRSDG